MRDKSVRFCISRFPDSVTESLTRWKILYHNTIDVDDIGNPKFGLPDLTTYTMLLESPTSLNIPGGLSCETMIKEKVLEGLKSKAKEGTIKNSIITESFMYTEEHKLNFINWFFSIKPIFPIFLIEFYTSTYFSITERVVSIFSEFKANQTCLSKNFPAQVYDVIVKSEKSNGRPMWILST